MDNLIAVVDNEYVMDFQHFIGAFPSFRGCNNWNDLLNCCKFNIMDENRVLHKIEIKIMENNDDI